MANNHYYKVDNSEMICAKRFTSDGVQSIIFIDVKTDGLKFSHTITKPFSIKNIESFLKSKFLNIKRIKNN
jgi:hypothetical protein